MTYVVDESDVLISVLYIIKSSSSSISLSSLNASSHSPKSILETYVLS